MRKRLSGCAGWGKSPGASLSSGSRRWTWSPRANMRGRRRSPGTWGWIRAGLRSNNVLDVGYDEGAIYEAIARCIGDPAFRAQCASCGNPYGAGNAGPRIAEVLANMPIEPRLMQKKMTY